MEGLDCPCGLGEDYGACCGRFHGGAAAPTAELLMRSRYSAFAVGDAAYLLRTWHSSTRPRKLELDPACRWTRLAVLETRGGGLFDTDGTVSFRAVYVVDGRRGVLDETSRFVREAKRWVYLGPVDAQSAGGRALGRSCGKMGACPSMPCSRQPRAESCHRKTGGWRSAAPARGRRRARS
jgi:SEC-C motif domain protein